MYNLRFLLILLPKKFIINRSSSQIVILHHSRLLESVYFHPCSNGVGLLEALHFQKTLCLYRSYNIPTFSRLYGITECNNIYANFLSYRS